MEEKKAREAQRLEAERKFQLEQERLAEIERFRLLKEKEEEERKA